MWHGFLHEKLHTAPGLSPEELTLVAREKLRGKYTAAEVGITGANFIICGYRQYRSYRK